VLHYVTNFHSAKNFTNFTPNCFALATAVVIAERGSNIDEKICKILPFLRDFVS